jgi:hypothetical protein
MTAVPVAERMTADEYLARSKEDRRTELIDGEIVVDEPQALLGHLYIALTDWIRAAPGRNRALVSRRFLSRGDVLTSPSLPGFALGLDALFPQEDHDRRRQPPFQAASNETDH